MADLDLRAAIRPLTGAAGELDDLVDRMGRAHYVLIGEASHGTHEFYALRAELTKRLVREAGFSLVAVEADWPDAYRVNRYVRHASLDRTAAASLASFERFPRWMWRNQVVLEFVDWLRAHNARANLQTGFYGIDLYSLHASIHAVLGYLDRRDPDAARAARERYGCFDTFGDDPQRYGHATALGYLPSCEQEVLAQLTALHENARALLNRDGLHASDEHFFAEQNARVVKNAERYYRAMYRGGIASWNLRDTHMADTIDGLCRHVSARGDAAKVVVWAHNSHLGDARATALGALGELNLGQLLRERHPRQTFVLGFSTHHGEVTAATDWDGSAEKTRVRPALAESYEALFHALSVPRFLLHLGRPIRELGKGPRLQRAIGVVYRPQTERASHYYHTEIARQFDAVIHIDETTAIAPLEGHGHTPRDELPETFPSGL